MAKVLVTDTSLTNIANAIRGKNSTSTTYKPAEMAAAIANLPSGGTQNWTAEGRALPQDLAVSLPASVTTIGNYAFNNIPITSIAFNSNITYISACAFKSTKLTEITIPETVTKIGDSAFQSVPITHIVIPSATNIIDNSAFYSCASLTTVKILSRPTQLSGQLFAYCSKLSTINIPSSINSIGWGVFYRYENLELVTIDNGFNVNGDMCLSASTKYSRETIVSWLNALYNRTGLTSYRFTIGSTNLAKLTTDDIAIATNKNWTLA